MKSNVVLFWDIENVTPPSSDSLFIDGLIEYAEVQGRVIASYAYADWSRFKRLSLQLMQHHFHMVHLPHKSKYSSKNSSDMQLVTDALEILRFYEHIDTYILITGDSDFRPLLRTLKRTGKKIYIVCDIKTASQDLLMIADNFTDYRDLVPDNDEDEIEDESNHNNDLKYWFERLSETAQILEKENKTSNMGSIKIKMKMLNQNFDEKSLGFKRWSRFVAAAVEDHFISIDGETIKPNNKKLTVENQGSLQVALKTLVSELETLDKENNQEKEFHPYSVLSNRLNNQNINIKTLGFKQFKKFIASAEARGLVETKTENLKHYVRIC